LLFITLLVFVSCAIDKLDSSVDLDSVPEFVQLTSSPISKVFLSAISLRMEESTEKAAGFAKVMALINELIHDNRKQLQQIRRINERVKGQCLVSNNKLANRERNFSTLLRYFKARGALALSEKSEGINMQNSRKQQASDYAAAKARFSVEYARKSKKWATRVKDLQDALTRINSALKAIADWKPATKPALIEEAVKESVDSYQKAMEYPLTYDSEMIELAANDNKIRLRLSQWMTFLKASVINSLDIAQTAGREITASYNKMQTQLTQLIALETNDAVRIGKSIANWTLLIKNYGDNEKIYTALSAQTALVLKANKAWCKVETSNYEKNRDSMEAQLKVFVDLKQWLRKNYSRIRDWIRKKYNH